MSTIVNCELSGGAGIGKPSDGAGIDEPNGGIDGGQGRCGRGQGRGAAEAAIGLAIVSSIYRNRKSTRINQANLLNKRQGIGGRGQGRGTWGQGRGARGRNSGNSIKLVDEHDKIRSSMEHEYMEQLLVVEEEKRVAEENARQEEFDEEALIFTLEKEEKVQKEMTD
ncbi:hypothetical protein Tco_1099500 [Tanacetum coccineum]